MQTVFEKIIEKFSNIHRVVKSDEDLEWNRSVYKCAKIVKQEGEQYNNGWIPVEEELPKDGDNRYYMCIVENHEEDPPMYCQYDEECGFGFYQDIYDENTLGFVDSEFQTNEELGYEKVIAWQQLLLYQPKKNRTNCKNRHENGNCLAVGGFCTAVSDKHCQYEPKGE